MKMAQMNPNKNLPTTLDLLTPDERYAYNERLAILGSIGNPTDGQHAVAMGDVHRLRHEMAGAEHLRAAQARAQIRP